MNQKLETIKQNVINCTKCDLCKTRTNAVPGKGNFQSDVIFVGEAPGRNEDKHGEPFIGVAGKKLSIALDEAGISRDDVYITNIVKCRPPNNRVPKTSERDTCQEYLKQEISIIKPKITERNKAMFGDVGMAYVYFTYGMYFCFNVVARHPRIKAGAVLIRAIEPEKGINVMQKNRKIINFKNLTNGPAKLTQALEITKEHYGADLTKYSKLFITDGIKKPRKIFRSPRIGIKEATDKLWNFKIEI